MSYSRHAYNSAGNVWYTGVTQPAPGYPGTDGTWWGLDPGTGKPKDPIKVADLDAYFATSLNGAAWAALDKATKDAALAEAERWLATLCWHYADCCGRSFQDAYLMALAELALALATDSSAIIGGGAADGRWVKRERLDVLEQEYGLLADTSGQVGPAGDGRYPLIIQRFPWLKDILGCWLQLGPKREIRLYRN